MNPFLRRAFLILFLASLSGVTRGQTTSVSDLALTATITPGTRILPGTVGRIAFTIRNNGPDTAQITGVVSSFYLLGPGEQFYLYELAETAPCRLDFDDFAPMQGQPVILVALLFDNGPIAPGGAVTCTVGIGAWPVANGTTNLQFRAGHGSVGFVDPNPSNDSVNFLLSFDADAIPALSLGCLVTLLVLALWLGIRHLGEVR